MKIDPLTRWEEVWKLTTDLSRDTIGALGLEIPLNPEKYKSRFNLLRPFEGYFSKTRLEWISFVVSHFVIHLVNSKMMFQKTEWIRKIFKIRQAKAESMKDLFFIGNNIYVYGWVKSQNYIFDVISGILTTKNFYLMIKDIALARCLSTPSLTYRFDRDTDLDHTLSLRLLYDLGDNILTKHGNNSYKTIKLLEAACINQWNKLGHQYRPLIPCSVSLENHLKIHWINWMNWELIPNNYSTMYIIKLTLSPYLIFMERSDTGVTLT